ncbi:MAG: hypothetical protein CVV37_04640 [Nitrospira bacterium HGW-Nitrospira-1]|nr:MAG: hypothetical protein CVV37_04640 [Nitrospira bacterium HGW-Nitrospira-1]
MVYFLMGDTNLFQTLTKEDKITVVLYRTGIFLSTLIISISAFIVFKSLQAADTQVFPFIISGLSLNVMLLVLYFSVGLSVFFIHLYIGKFYRALKKIYYIAVVCLAVLFFIGHGNPVIPLLRVPPYGALLLLPLSLCLGFVTAKEAFCFRLIEGYILAVMMPAHVFFYSVGVLDAKSAAYGFIFIAFMLVFFMFRKIFMPLHYDIGDKSAYQP